MPRGLGLPEIPSARRRVRVWAGAGARRAPFIKGRVLPAPSVLRGAGVGVRGTRVWGSCPAQCWDAGAWVRSSGDREPACFGFGGVEPGPGGLRAPRLMRGGETLFRRSGVKVAGRAVPSFTARVSGWSAALPSAL